MQTFVDSGLIQSLLSLTETVTARQSSPRPHNLVLNHSALEQNQPGTDQSTLPPTECIHLEEDRTGIEMLTDILYILARACKDSAVRKTHLPVQAIDSILSLLSALPTRFAQLESNSACSPFKLQLATLSVRPFIHRICLLKLAVTLVDVIWCCIVGSGEHEQYFLTRNGAWLLLDLLECYPRKIAHQVVGCLVDLSETQLCLPQLRSWSGIRSLGEDDQMDAVGFEAIPRLMSFDSSEANQHKLTKLAHPTNRMEGTAVNVPTDEATTIAFDEGVKMLATGPRLIETLCALWRWEETERSELPDDPTVQLWSDSSTSIRRSTHSTSSTKSTDVSSVYRSRTTTQSSEYDKEDRLRMNIYALLLRLGFPQSSQISLKDQITMTEIEHYFDLKNSEVWCDIRSELENEHIRPVTPDAQLLDYVERWGSLLADELLKAKQIMMKSKDDAALEEERMLYARIAQFQQFEANRRANYESYLARTSSIECLKSAKRKQIEAIAASRVREPGPTVRIRLEEHSPPSEGMHLRHLRRAGSSSQEITGLSGLQQSGATIHHVTDVPGLNVTDFSSQVIRVESTPRQCFDQPTKLEYEMLKVVPPSRSS
ncbi:unnamed protein product [Dicrocoelium dendriticum]|nr:unnamed protein product [Dicrocoelium dendriticum]